MKKSKDLFEDLYINIGDFINSSRYKKEMNSQFFKFKEMFFDTNVTELFSLNERNLSILRKRYGVFTNNIIVTYDKIGEEYDLTKVRIEQIVSSSIRKCKLFLELYFKECEMCFYNDIHLLDFLEYNELPKELGDITDITLNQLFSINDTYKKNLIRNVILMKIYKVVATKKYSDKFHERDKKIIGGMLLNFLYSINICDLFLSSDTYYCLYGDDIYNLGMLVNKKYLYDIKDINKEMVEEIEKYLRIDSVITVKNPVIYTKDENELRKLNYLISCTIEDLDFSRRTYNALKRAGFNYGEQLLYKTKEELICMYGLGRKATEEVLEKINNPFKENYSKIKK